MFEHHAYSALTYLGKNLLDFFMAPFSQMLEPPQNRGDSIPQKLYTLFPPATEFRMIWGGMRYSKLLSAVALQI